MHPLHRRSSIEAAVGTEYRQGNRMSISKERKAEINPREATPEETIGPYSNMNTRFSTSAVTDITDIGRPESCIIRKEASVGARREHKKPDMSNRRREESTENILVFDDKIRSKPHTPANTSRRDKGTTAESSEDPKSGTVSVSDDPKRGASVKNTESEETKVEHSDTSSTRKAANDTMNNDLHTPAGGEVDVKQNTTVSQEM